MMRGRRFLALLVGGGLLLAAAPAPQAKDWRAPRRYRKRINPLPVDKGTLRIGRKIYKRECESCHGAKGKGDGKAASGLEVRPRDLSDPKRMGSQTDGELFYKIRTGRRPMPTYRNDLSDEEIWAVIHYIRKFSGTGKAGRPRPRWFRGKPPVPDAKAAAALRAASQRLLAAAWEVAAALRSADQKQAAKAAGALHAELAGLAKVAGTGRIAKELTAFRKLAEESLGTAPDAAHLAAFCPLLAQLLERYRVQVDGVWKLYRLDLPGKEPRTLRWFQPADEKPVPPEKGRSGKRAVAEKVFPVTPKEKTGKQRK